MIVPIREVYADEHGLHEVGTDVCNSRTRGESSANDSKPSIKADAE